MSLINNLYEADKNNFVTFMTNYSIKCVKSEKTKALFKIEKYVNGQQK